MESNDELEEIDIKNCTCCYFDDMIKIEDFDLDNILIDKKSSKNILVQNNILNKSLIDYESLRIRFDKIDGFIKVSDGNRYLALFRSEKYDSIYDRIRYPDILSVKSVKSAVTYIVSCNYVTIEIDSYENRNNHYYNTFLEKGSYEDKSNDCNWIRT